LRLALARRGVAGLVGDAAGLGRAVALGTAGRRRRRFVGGLGGRARPGGLSRQALDVEFLEGSDLFGSGDPLGQIRFLLAQLVECVVDLQGAVAADPETVGPREGVTPEAFSLALPVGRVGDD